MPLMSCERCATGLTNVNTMRLFHVYKTKISSEFCRFSVLCHYCHLGHTGPLEASPVLLSEILQAETRGTVKTENMLLLWLSGSVQQQPVVLLVF